MLCCRGEDPSCWSTYSHFEIFSTTFPGTGGKAVDNIKDSGCDLVAGAGVRWPAGNVATADESTDEDTAVERLSEPNGLARLLAMTEGTEAVVPQEKMGIVPSIAGSGIDRPDSTDDIGVPAT